MVCFSSLDTSPSGAIVARAQIHYLEWGTSGNPIVFLHSMSMDAHAFDSIAQSMAMDNHILAIDLLGHGESSKLTLKKISAEKHMELIYEIIMKRKFQSNFNRPLYWWSYFYIICCKIS